MRSARPARRAIQTLAGGTAALLVLAGCAAEATEGSSSGGSGDGIAAGATKAEYHEAFADIDPITIITQTTGPKGSSSGARFEAYHEAITEWSNGKITFDTSYSNAIAPPPEAADALADGRLDLVNVQTVYQPEEFPANNSLVDLSFVGDHSPVVGQLQAQAWMADVGFADEFAQEYEDLGIKMLLPSFHGGSPTMMCTEERRTLSALKGAQSVAAGKSAMAQLEALGVTPVTLDYTEIYESLQRGVVDCVEGSFTIAVLGGYIEATPNVVLDPQVGFARSPGAMAMSLSTWESLPLVAQQLFHDRLDVFIEASMEGIFQAIAEGVQAVTDAGGELQTWADDAREALTAANDDLLEQARGNDALQDADAFVDAVQESSDKWFEILTEDLGYSTDHPYAEWAQTWADEGVDLEPFIERIRTEVLDEHRPE